LFVSNKEQNTEHIEFQLLFLSNNKNNFHMNEIRNISDLFLIYENKTPGRIMYFRGQVFDWPLKPSLARDNVSEHERAKESECFVRLAEILLEVNDWERATIAQHYGVPTRLIDWTENPLVGLYFATENNSFDNNDGVIWVFEDKTAVAGEVASIRCEIGPRQLNYPRPYRAWKDLKNVIPRTFVQRGSLTSQPDLSVPFNEQKFDSNTQSIKKYLVPKRVKSHLRKKLNVLDICKKRLFPDFLDIANNGPTDLVGGCMRIRCEIFNTRQNYDK
jgi:hypothetical protein